MRPIRKGIDYESSCVAVQRLRAIDANGVELWDRWCATHCHWLNEAPARNIVEAMLDVIAGRKP